MSTRDALMEISDAYKLQQGDKVGHAFPLLGQISGTYNATYGTVFPMCGPLLVVNMNEQRWTTGCDVTFTYRRATLSGYIPHSFNGITYERKEYTTGIDTGIYTGNFSITSGTREYHQHYFGNDMIYEVISITGSDPLQELNFYCLADDGSRLMYIHENEDIRDIEQTTELSLFTHPPVCKLCSGYGTYNDAICTDCSGYGFVGNNAWGYMLSQRGEDVGLKQKSETEQSFQWRIWAKKWHMIPTKNEVKRYMGTMLRISTGLLTIEEYYTPEPYWIIRYPLEEGIGGVGHILSTSGQTLQEIVSYCEAAGTRAIILGYYTVASDGSIWDYDHRATGTRVNAGLSDPPHTEEQVSMIDWFFFDDVGSFNTHNWGCEWSVTGNDYNGSMFFYEDKYILTGATYNSGIVYYAGTGYWSGATEMTGIENTDYWSGTSAVNASGYNFIMRFDMPFTCSGTWLVGLGE